MLKLNILIKVLATELSQLRHDTLQVLEVIDENPSDFYVDPEMGLNQKALAELIGVSPSRLSDYISGKCEPTLKVAREISQKLNIDANIVLGV